MVPRTILYTGKGGVGKTSVAAATARRCAAAGLRTVVLSTDPAHSLADVLELPVATEPTEIGRNLYDQKIDSAGFARSSDRYAVRGGLELDLGEKFSGEIAAGFSTACSGTCRLTSTSRSSTGGWARKNGK